MAGLGGNPYRDGSYQYYLSEKVVTYDPKGMGSEFRINSPLGFQRDQRKTEHSTLLRCLAQELLRLFPII